MGCSLYGSLLTLLCFCSDVAMLLRDPYALHIICKSTVSCLFNLVDTAKLPRVSWEGSMVLSCPILCGCMCRRAVSWSVW